MTIRSFNDPNSTEARQFLLDRRGERAHPKRHRTKKRSHKMREARKQKATVHNATKASARKRYLARVRDYWAGITGAHP